MTTKWDMTSATRDFTRAMDQAAKLTGFNRAQIIMGSAGVILKTCASRTKVATVSNLTAGARLRTLRGLQLTRGGPVTINAGLNAAFGVVFLRKKSGTGYRRTHDYNFKPLNQHYSNDEWAVIEAAVESAKQKIPVSIKKAQASSGLARQSWILIADSLGIALETVSGGGSITSGSIHKAREARARGGAQRNNGLSKRETDQGRFFVTLINRLPYLDRIGLEGILVVAMAGHAKYFFTSVEKGFDGSLEQSFKKFPAWTVRR